MAKKKNRRPEKSTVETTGVVNDCFKMRRLLEKEERNEEEQSNLQTLIERWWKRESPLLQIDRLADLLDNSEKKEAYVFVLDAWRDSLEKKRQAAENILPSKEGGGGLAPDVMDRLEKKRQRSLIHNKLGGKPVMDTLNVLCPSYDQGIENADAACLKAARKKERKHPLAAVHAALSALFTAVRCSISFVFNHNDNDRKQASGVWFEMSFNRKKENAVQQEKEKDVSCDQ